MNASRTTPAARSRPSGWDVLFNWLALLMLLAGGVVWPY
jgi:hypothetical protein